MTVIAPTDAPALETFGRSFWLNELQPLRGLELLDEAAKEAREAQDDGRQVADTAWLRSMTIADVDVLQVVTARDCGCSYEKAVILTMPVQGSIDGATLLEAVWAGYMLSLKATMDGGKNPRAHVGDDEDAVDLAISIATRLGATMTPCDEVYGSGGTYLEAIGLTYDAATRTLSADPCIGS